MNINDRVSVTLTQHGADVYNKWASQFSAYLRPADKKAGDVMKDNLWHMFQVFGGAEMYLGMAEVPFLNCQMIFENEEK